MSRTRNSVSIWLLMILFAASSLAFAPARLPARPLLCRNSKLFQSSVGLEAGNSPTTAEASSVIQTAEPEPDVDEQKLQQQPRDLGIKVMNGLLLAASFGFAAYTILTIDSGMTRGWTSSEIALRIPLDNWLNYENSLAGRPIFTKTLINVIIYLLGDWLSQTVFAGKPVLEFDAMRTLRNGFIGLCFGPLVHEYYQFSDHILPVEGGTLNRLEKIVMDQTVYLSVKCSIYIAAVGLLKGDDFSDVKENVKNKLPNIVVTAWKFWPLVHLVTYGVIPARHRILWVNCVDLVWNAILATMSQAKQATETAEVETTETVLEVAEEILPEANVLELTHMEHELLKESILKHSEHVELPELLKEDILKHTENVELPLDPEAASLADQENDALLAR